MPGREDPSRKLLFLSLHPHNDGGFGAASSPQFVFFHPFRLSFRWVQRTRVSRRLMDGYLGSRLVSVEKVNPIIVRCSLVQAPENFPRLLIRQSGKCGAGDRLFEAI